MNKPNRIPFVGGLFLALVLSQTGWAARQVQPWDFDRIAAEPLPTWRFLAVDRLDAPLPTVEPSRLGEVTLPWTLERPCPMGYWLNEVRVPARFQGRDVILEVEAYGPTQVFVNGASAATSESRKESILRVPLVTSDQGAASFALTIACRHGDAPAKLVAARLVAEPHGLTAALARRDQVLQSMPRYVLDANPATWRVKVKGPDDAFRTDFDDSQWETAKPDFTWPEQYTPCWFRGRITVPTEIAGRSAQGRPLHLRVNFDDAGKLFLNGHEVVAEGALGVNSFALPAEFLPGAEIAVALRVLNNWGDGRIRSIEWRFADMDAAEAGLNGFATEARSIERALRLHDRPRPEWLVTFNQALDILVAGQSNVDDLSTKVQAASEVLTHLEANLAEVPILVLPPYLQDQHQDGVTVMWETSAPVKSFVEYGINRPKKKVEETPAAKRIHKVKLTGLRPDTEYQYRVISGGYQTQTLRFHTAPKQERPFNFLVWGDNRSDWNMCDRVCQRMAEADAELVVSTGDVVASGGSWEQWTKEYLVPMRHWSHKWPSYVSIGNHEYGGASEEPPRVAGFEQYLANPITDPSGSEYWFSFDYANAHFVILDGNRFDEVHEGKTENDWTIAPTDPQLRWVERDLTNAASKYKWVFVFIHEPPYSEGWSGGYYDGEPPLRNSLVPILERHGVDIVFSGHTHDYERGLPHPPYDPATGKGNNAAYIITGGGGAALDNHKYKEWEQIDIPDHPAVADSDKPDEGQYYKYHYTWVRVDGDTVTLEAREVLPDGRLGPVFDALRLHK